MLPRFSRFMDDRYNRFFYNCGYWFDALLGKNSPMIRGSMMRISLRRCKSSSSRSAPFRTLETSAYFSGAGNRHNESCSRRNFGFVLCAYRGESSDKARSNLTGSVC